MVKIAEICRIYWKSPTTIRFSVAKKDSIKEANVAKGKTVLTKQRSQTPENVNNLGQ